RGDGPARLREGRFVRSGVRVRDGVRGRDGPARSRDRRVGGEPALLGDGPAGEGVVRARGDGPVGAGVVRRGDGPAGLLRAGGRRGRGGGRAGQAGRRGAGHRGVGAEAPETGGLPGERPGGGGGRRGRRGGGGRGRVAGWARWRRPRAARGRWSAGRDGRAAAVGLPRPWWRPGGGATGVRRSGAVPWPPGRRPGRGGAGAGPG